MARRKIVLLIVLLIFVTLTLFACTTKIEVPSVKKASFNFSVTYEIDGEENTYNGVYVCKFDGVYISLVGSGREWESYIEGANGETVVPIKTNEDGIIYLDFNFNPEYFMLDPDSIYYDEPVPELYLVYYSDDPDVSSFCYGEEFTSKYNAKINSYDYKPLEENVYKERLRFGRCEFTIN